MDRLFFRMFFICFLFAFVVLLVVYNNRCNEIRGYEQTKGTVTHIETRDGYVWLTYDYTVDGIEMQSMCRGEHRHIEETYTLFYNPQNPKAIIDSQPITVSFWHLVFVAIALVISGLLCVISWYLDKKKHKRNC